MLKERQRIEGFVCWSTVITILLCFTAFPAAGYSQEYKEDICVFLDSTGTIRSVPKSKMTPKELKTNICQPAIKKQSSRPSQSQLDSRAPSHPTSQSGLEVYKNPNEVSLTGANRNFEFSTPVGRLKVRWQVTSTEYFGRDPYFLVKEAWNEGARTLARHQFPDKLRNSKVDWNIVFMDEKATHQSYPFGKEACHPAWIRPPADIFISAFYIGTECGRKKLSETESRLQLKSTLYHEFGHAVEYQLLGKMLGRSERYHSEGFAQWFEAMALQDHGMKAEAEKIKNQAKVDYSQSWDPQSFAGTNEDYNRAFAMIDTLVKKRKLAGLLQVYKDIQTEEVPFATAVYNVTGWNQRNWSAKTSALYQTSKR
jgi:hypothetical protein